MPFDLATYGLSVVTAGGGAAAIGYGVFKAFGAKWMDSRFARQLERSKQAHATEQLHLKFKIDGMLDRATKLNQREFEVLPDIWLKATNAHFALSSLIALYREGGDLTSYTNEQLDELLKKSDLFEWEKNELRGLNPHERSTYYMRARERHEHSDTIIASREFSFAVERSSIYLHPDTLPKIAEFAREIAICLHTFGWNKQLMAGEKPEKDDEVMLYRKHGQEHFEALRDFLQARYWTTPAFGTIELAVIPG